MALKDKIITTLLTVVLLALLLMPCAGATGLEPDTDENSTGYGVDYGSEYRIFLDGIPNDIAELLPESIFSDKADGQCQAAKEMSGFSYIVRILLDIFGVKAGAAVKMLCGLCVLVFLSALFNAAHRSGGADALSEPFSICVNAAVLAAILSMQGECIRAVSLFLERLSVLVNSMIPLVGVLYACGGNVGTATVTVGSLGIFINLCENLCNRTLIPIVGVCLVFSAASAFAPKMNIGSISKSVKKTYTFLLGFVMTVFATVMGAQTLLASKADSLGAKAAKYAVSTFIPVAGGTVGDSLRTVAASAEYIRGSVGISAIIIIILLLLPTLISLIFSRLAINISGAAASMLGCDGECRLLEEISNIYGYMIAVCSFCSVLFIYALTLFVQISAAIGG